jgi:hypothetical protein
MITIHHDDDVYTDECLGLLSLFMKIKDRKARAEIIRFAERCVYFDGGGVVDFGQSRESSDVE